MSSQKKTLLLDLDGVLIDMVVPLMRWWGVCIGSEEQYPQQFGWDVQGAIAHLLNQRGRMRRAIALRNMPKEVFWHAPPRSFWRELQPYPMALDFVKFLESGPFDIYILTAHANADCAAAKLDWIDEHLPRYWNRVLLGHPKHVTATPQSILIDDCTKNCEEFTAAGGTAILCPRPWNKRWGEPDCFMVADTGRPEYNVVTKDLHDIMGHSDTP
jgi:5'(3')-deoxyribonucleotidase